jgi:acetylglutamate/LysW-gamma-L-alpha-aminoadipate kinase
MTMMIVVKTGGRVIENGVPENLVKDIGQSTSTHQLVFVHGGGVEVTEIAKKMGKPQKFVVSPNGFRSRYTDKDTVDIYTMVMVGKLNSDIVIKLESHGIASIGLSGLDGRLLQAERKKRLIILDDRGRRRVIDGGYTGQITEVNTTLLQLLLNQHYIPVIAPVALSEEFEPLNVDGDRSAAHIAGALKADRLVLLTDVDGLLVDETLVSELTTFEAKALLPKIGPGMITKVYAALEAIEKGVEEVIISSGFHNQPISSAINHEHGTVIRNV